ncbi:MAG: PadR family transcriptional regulator [Erysipelotrichaceae bacterium]
MALTEAVYYILLSLVQPLHGYGIMQHIESMSNGRVKLAAGTLYGALENMLKKGWIKEVVANEPSRKKAYEITAEGKRVLGQEYLRLEELLTNGKTIVEGASYEKNSI